MPIMIDGRRYKVGKAAYSCASILVDPDGSASWRHTFKRKDGPEKDALFQARVQAAVIKMRRDKVRDPTGVVVAMPEKFDFGDDSGRAAGDEARGDDREAVLTSGGDARDDGGDDDDGDDDGREARGGDGGDDGGEASGGSMATTGGGGDDGGEPAAKRQRGNKGKRKGHNVRRWEAAKGR
eukprot:scaffold9646_cov25-Phaeocystis_antarctica.AAC.1